MEKWYFTFGVGTALKDRVAMYEGSYKDARKQMCKDYGMQWCMQYSEEQMEEQFKNYGYGIILDNKQCGKKYCIRNKMNDMLKKSFEEDVSEITELVINEVFELAQEQLRNPDMDNCDIPDYFISWALFTVMKEKLAA